MTIQELMDTTGAKLLTKTTDLQGEITSGYSCDLLSWVMAHGTPGMLWVTVQTHMNVIAVATLHEMRAVLIPEGGSMPEDVIAKAEEEGVAVLSSEKSAYEICGLVYAAGVRGK